MKNLKKLNNLIKLSSNVKIYVPSTMDVDQVINPQKFIDSTLQLLSGFFGGSTSYNALGCWSSQKGLVKEKVVICESYCNEKDLNNNIEKIIAHCEGLKTAMSQEAISLEINNELYFI